MTTFYPGDCVRIRRGPGGNYPFDPSLVGLRGTWRGTPATIEFIEGQPRRRSRSAMSPSRDAVR